MEELYKRDLFLNKNYPYIFNAFIREYDLEEAGYSLIKEYKLLDKETIDELEPYDKERRTVEIGKIQRKNKLLTKELSAAFVNARKLFITLNNLDSTSILSIKKDAIFIIDDRGESIVQKEKFGKFLNFRVKNEYTSYLTINNRIECYYNGKLDVKNLGKENEEKHTPYMLDFIKTFFDKMELSVRTTTSVRYLKNMVDSYKHRELDVGYYRTFNQASEYITITDNNTYDEFENERIDELDISFNLFNVILPLFRILL